MKLKFEGTKEEFESLFGIAVNIPVETAPETVEEAIEAEPKKLKIGEIVRLINPVELDFNGDEGADYIEFYNQLVYGWTEVTGIDDNGFYIVDETLTLSDDYFTGEKTKIRPHKVKDKKASKNPSGLKKLPEITADEVRAKVDFAKYSTIPELVNAITESGFRKSQLARLLGVDAGGISHAAKGRVYGYVERAFSAKLLYIPTVK